MKELEDYLKELVDEGVIHGVVKSNIIYLVKKLK